MTGTSLRIKDANFTKYITSMTIPDRAGLVHEFILGVNATQSTRNFANPATVPTIVGSPVYSPYYMLGGAGATGPGGVSTGILLNEPGNEPDQTFIGISRRQAANPNAPGIFTTVTTVHGLTAGIGGSTTNTTAAFYNSQGGVAPAFPQITGAAPTVNFTFHAGWGSVGGYGSVTMARANALLTPVVGTAVGGVRTTNSLSILGNGTLTGNGGVEVAYIARFTRILTIPELTAVYQSLKSFYAGKIVIE
jgi:hypothetical protein